MFWAIRHNTLEKLVWGREEAVGFGGRKGGGSESGCEPEVGDWNPGTVGVESWGGALGWGKGWARNFGDLPCPDQNSSDILTPPFFDFPSTSPLLLSWWSATPTSSG